MSTPFDVVVEVKTEIEEPPSSDEDKFLSSINDCDCDSNNQSIFGDNDGGSRTGRCLRNRKIKTEAESSEEDDYDSTQWDEDDEWGRGKKKKKSTKSKQGCPSAKIKKVRGDSTSAKSNSPSGGGMRRTRMSEEDKRERERERKRLFRLREKDKSEEALTLARSLGEGEDGEIKKEVESSGGEEEDGGGKLKRRKEGGYRKKKVSEMTEEEKEHKRALWRQQAEKKRAKRRELEGREKQRRGGNRKPKPLTPELLEHRRLQRNKWIREYRNRVKKDPEKWQRFKEKDSENRKINRMRKKKDGNGGGEGEEIKLTEEEREQRRIQDYFRKQARLAGMTEEERERRRELLREKNRLKWENIKKIPGEYEKIQERRRKWREGLNEEKKERFLEKLRENARKQHERWRRDPLKWEEMKERWREKRRRRKVELEGGAVKKKWEWSEAMKKKFEEKERRGRVIGIWGGGRVLTEEENRRRLELRRLQDKRRSLKRKLWVQGLLDEGMSIEQIMQQTETPEHRSHRLSVQRIAKAKRDLRKRLLKFGAPAEEIQQKVIELERTYQPCKEINRYRQSWKRVDPKELDELEVKLKIEVEKFNEFLKSNSNQSTSVNVNSTAIITSTSKVLVSSSQGKVEIQKTKNQHPNSLQIPSTSSTLPQPAPPPQLSHQVAYQPQPPPPPNPYFSHQDFLHQFSFQSHPQQSQLPPPPPSSSHFYPESSSSTSPTTPCQPHSLQNILHSMNLKYQQDNPLRSSSNQTTSIPSQPNYSTYGDDDSERGYSPPPPPENSYHHHQPAILHPPPPPQNLPQFNPPPPLAPPQVQEKRPRAKRKSTAATPSSTSTSPLKYLSYPRLKRDQVLRDVICDQCGKPFNNQYIRSHKKIYHNPNYDPKSKTCLLCNTQYPMSSKWYQHYVRDHLKKDKALNTIVCDLCGKKFKSILNYNKHIYFTHGDGLKQENRKKCPVCPDPPGRYFKENSSLQGHMGRFHPGHSWASGKHRCLRCDEGDFRNERILRQHVRDKHEESYFGCEFCGIWKFSRLAINFHYVTGKCLKMPKGWGRNEGEIKGVEGCEVVSLDRVEVDCEVCGRGIKVKSLMKHYRLVHNVEEEQDWRCLECGRGYKRREGMVVHMEEAHGRRVDKDGEMREVVRRLNQENREGLRVERRKKVGWGKKRGRGDEEKRRGKGKGRRWIKVICEEDGES